MEKYESKAKFSIRKEAVGFIKKSKFPMAIFTDNMHSVVRKVLKSAGILDHFEIIIGKDDVAEFKPHHEGLEMIVNGFKCRDRKKYLLIGNSDKDSTCSKNFGVEFIHVDEISA